MGGIHRVRPTRVATNPPSRVAVLRRSIVGTHRGGTAPGQPEHRTAALLTGSTTPGLVCHPYRGKGWFVGAQAGHPDHQPLRALPGLRGHAAAKPIEFRGLLPGDGRGFPGSCRNIFAIVKVSCGSLLRLLRALLYRLDPLSNRVGPRRR